MSSILLFGRPGSGKTTLLSTFIKLGYKVVIVDPDQKADKMMNLSNFVKSGKLIPIPIDEKLSEITLRQRMLTPAVALSKQPKGYLKICDAIEVFEKELAEGKSRQDEVLAIDSLTSVIEHLKRMISYMTKKDKFSYDEWNILLVTLEEFIMTIIRLQKLFKHVVIIAHEMSETDDEGRVMSILPAVEGSMKNKITKYFEEAYRTRVKVANGKAEYLVQTIPMDKSEARTSRPLAPLTPSDFAIIFQGEMATPVINKPLEGGKDASSNAAKA